MPAVNDDLLVRARSLVGTAVLCGKCRLDAVLSIGGHRLRGDASRNVNRVAAKVLERSFEMHSGGA
jgi:hypothetical protein